MFQHCSGGIVGCRDHELIWNADAEALEDLAAEESRNEVVVGFLMLLRPREVVRREKIEEVGLVRKVWHECGVILGKTEERP